MNFEPIIVFLPSLPFGLLLGDFGCLSRDEVFHELDGSDFRDDVEEMLFAAAEKTLLQPPVDDVVVGEAIEERHRIFEGAFLKESSDARELVVEHRRSVEDVRGVEGAIERRGGGRRASGGAES